MSPVSGREVAERITPKTSATMSVIAGAMGMGIVMLIVMIGLMHLQCKKTPSPDEIRSVNLLTGFAMVCALVTIVASEIAWKTQVKRFTADTVDASIQTAFIVRTALREGSALMGCVVCLIAALNGTLKVYPAYWIDLGPAALFFGYLAMHWPSVDNLRAEIIAALPQ